MQVIVLGAGVVGLSTAIKAQDEGHSVTIIADSLPGDVKSTHYTSSWAGAHHVSHSDASTPLQQEYDAATFREMWAQSDPQSDAQGCFMRIQQTEFYLTKQERPHPLELLGCYPELRYIEKNELVPGATDGITLQTFTIDTPAYLPYLLSKFLGKGGRVARARIQHIDQVIAGAFTPGVKPDAVIVCAGLGARFLGGVEDKDVYPIRGQTVLIRAPWVRSGRTLSTDDLWTYIIPRRSGDVILGGTKLDNDWYPLPRPETVDDILRRTLEIMPEIAPPAAREGGRTPTIDDVRSIIIENGCGFRPGRKGGIRMECEWRQVSGTSKQIPVIHNYGHGGQGYQSSWGSAIKAVGLLQQAFKEAHVQ